jgi:hypothetical protein
MRLGKRTTRLVREAIVLGFVEGAHWGRFWDGQIEGVYPKDSAVVARVLRAARSNRDLYPMLGRVDQDQYANTVIQAVGETEERA